MPRFSRKSRDKLETCDQRLQDIMNEVIKEIDVTIISGMRGAVEQDTLYEQGFSKVQFPNSKHNHEPSHAVDVVIWNKDKPHIRWDDKSQMTYLAGYIKGVADKLGIKIRIGADWNGDMVFNESFYDGPHVELIDE